MWLLSRDRCKGVGMATPTINLQPTSEWLAQPPTFADSQEQTGGLICLILYSAVHGMPSVCVTAHALIQTEWIGCRVATLIMFTDTQACS